MKHFITTLFFVIWLGSFAGAQSTTAGAPADTAKKAAPAPPAQLVTFPLSTLTSKMTLNGYTQVRFQYFTDTLSSHLFDVRRARLDLKGTPIRNLAYRMQIDFAPTVRVLDATVAYTLNNYLKITGGQFKVPFSLENILSSNLMESVNRSQVVEALVNRSRDVISSAGNNNGRDIGVMASGGIQIGTETKRNIVEYSAGIFNGTGINKSDNNREKDFSGRLLIFPVKQLSVGGSYYNGSATYGIDLKTPKNRDRFGAELFLNLERLTVRAEFIQGEDSTTTRNGYYAQVAGFIIPKKFQAVLKYDAYDANTDKEGDGSTIYQAGLNWLFSPMSKLQVAYDVKREEGDSEVQKDNDTFTVMWQLYF